MKKKACFSKEQLRRGAWTEVEDRLLSDYIESHGHGRWGSLPAKAGLNRCGKSCRLRWLNYLRPGIKRGNITAEEEELIIRLHELLGNRWSLIAGRIPGRTDNEIKNYWNSYLKKKVAMDVSESQSSSKATADAAAAAIATTTELSFRNSNNEKANDGEMQLSLLPPPPLPPLLPPASASASASASFDFGFDLESSFGELSNTSVFCGFGWRDVNSMAGSSVRRDVCNRERMEGNEEIPPLIDEVEWESLIKSCEAI